MLIPSREFPSDFKLDHSFSNYIKNNERSTTKEMYVHGHGIQVGSYFVRGRQEIVEKFILQTGKKFNF